MFSAKIQAVAAATVTAVLGLASASHAAYTLTPLSGGQNARTVVWGEAFAINVVLTSNTSLDRHTSAIFQTRFTRAGLLLEDYQWAVPYETGGIFDDSTPARADLPVAVTAGTLSGNSHPSGVVDFEMSNVLIGQSFSTGTLVTLSLRVPANFGFLGQIFIIANPDQFANGFDEVPTTAGAVFTLNIVPAPGAAGALMLASAMLAARRRR